MTRQGLSCPHPVLVAVLLRTAAGTRDQQPSLAGSISRMLCSHSPAFPTAAPAPFPAPPLNMVLMHSAHLDNSWKKWVFPGQNEVNSQYCHLCKSGRVQMRFPFHRLFLLLLAFRFINSWAWHSSVLTFVQNF